MNTEESLENIPCGFVALIGPPNAGKSTLLNALVGKKISIVSPKPQTTRNRILGIRHSIGSQIAFLDTPGFLDGAPRGELNKFIGTELRDVSADADLRLLVVDALKVKRDHGAAARLQEYLATSNIGSPAIVALNKCDLLDRPAILPLIKELYELLSNNEQKQSVEVVPISVTKNDGLTTLLELLEARLPKGPRLFPEDMSSDQTEEFLASEIIREKLFLHLREEIPYSLAVQIENWQEEEDLLRVSAVIFVERDSQRGIVIGHKGSMLKKIGSSARVELERLFGIRIFLELFVKVEVDWTKSSRGLLRAGYQRM